MAEHKLNPKEGEVWEHPLTRNRYTIHSLTSDGWVRYHIEGHGHPPLYTRPTLDFIKQYRKAEDHHG